MEIQNIANHLKHVNQNGVTLNIEERMNLVLSLKQLQNDYNFEELLFWGKINGNTNFSYKYFNIGTVKDYYIAVSLKYLGVSDFPDKQFFWCTSDNWTFA
jgi:radial spoke head protein 9